MNTMTQVMKIEEINYLVATSFNSHIHEKKISFQVLLCISQFFFFFGCVLVQWNLPNLHQQIAVGKVL